MSLPRPLAPSTGVFLAERGTSLFLLLSFPDMSAHLTYYLGSTHANLFNIYRLK